MRRSVEERITLAIMLLTVVSVALLIRPAIEYGDRTTQWVVVVLLVVFGLASWLSIRLWSRRAK